MHNSPVLKAHTEDFPITASIASFSSRTPREVTEQCRVLVVDDEAAIRRMLKLTLEARGYRVLESSTGSDAIETVYKYRLRDQIQAVFLDLGLPDRDGIRVTRQLRTFSDVPIIVISVRDREQDRIEALDAGADDYLSKPFAVGELMARLRVALRRSGWLHAQGEITSFTTDQLVVDLVERTVHVGGKQIHLTPTEYSLLRALVLEAGKVLTPGHLLRQIWRPKLGENPKPAGENREVPLITGLDASLSPS